MQFILIENGICHDSHVYAGKELYKCFKRNSGCYVKLGQNLCQLDHILPKPFTEALEPLCEECQTTDFGILKRMLDKTYGGNVFMSIEKEPLGSASIAQVHKGYLVDGTPVAIKVYYVYIDKTPTCKVSYSW